MPRRVEACVIAAALGLGACLGISHAADLDTALQGRLLERSDGVTFVYKDGFKYAVQSADLSATQVRAVPFKVQFTNSLGLQFASGSILALMRPDASIAIAFTQLDVGAHDNGSPLDLVIASLEQ
jgi:hypothetical protein